MLIMIYDMPLCITRLVDKGSSTRPVGDWVFVVEVVSGDGIEIDLEAYR
jgi:hypothetical protein